MASRITTKIGDSGTTLALSGERLSKGHAIMECVGSVDELRAHLALVRLLVLQGERAQRDGVAEFLLWLLHACFPIGTACSDPTNKHPEYRKVEIGAGHIQRLEAEQAKLESQLRLPKAFIVSASNTLAAQVDVACTVARRLERNVVRLREAIPEFDAGTIVVFLNRLSDYLYVLARFLEGGNHHAVDYGVLQNP